MNHQIGSFWKIGPLALFVIWCLSWSIKGCTDDKLARLSRYPHHFGLRIDGAAPQFFFECPQTDTLFADIQFRGRLEILNPPGNNQYLVVLKEDSLGALKKLRGQIKFEGYLIGGTYVVESRDVDTDTLKYKQRFRAKPISNFANI